MKNNANVVEDQQDPGQVEAQKIETEKVGTTFTKPLLPEGQLPPVLLGKRKAENQI